MTSTHSVLSTHIYPPEAPKWANEDYLVRVRPSGCRTRSTHIYPPPVAADRLGEAIHAYPPPLEGAGLRIFTSDIGGICA